VEPLASEFQNHGLLLPEGDTIYLSIGAEQLPLLNDVVDVVVSRNSIDHVESPAQVIREIHRVLKPGGIFILNTDINHPSTVCEPHTLTVDQIHIMTAQFRKVRGMIFDHGHGHTGSDANVYIGVLEKYTS
jgi:ubiquinone/menaquinone biosynthesis C-methylase UbiE